MDQTMTLGRLLAGWRAMARMTQAQAAAAAGISDGAISQWESDRVRPGSRSLARLLEAYGVPREEWADALALAGEP